MAIELALLLLMLFSGAAAGAAVLAAVAELVDAAQKSTQHQDVAKWGAYTALPALAIGLLASVFHLARPLVFVNGILNFGSSWISREGVFGISFLILAALYALTWFLAGRRQSVSLTTRRILAALSALGALALVSSTGMAYTIVRPIPAWNTPLTILFFAVSAALLGTLLVATTLAIVGGLAKTDDKKFPLWTALQPLPRAAAILALALLAVEGLRLIHLGAAPSDAAVQSLALIGGPLLGLTLARWVVGLALPCAILCYAWSQAKAKPQAVNTWIYVTFVCVVAGEVLARVLFFLSAVHI